MLGGYMGNVLRVDLSLGRISKEPLSEEMARKYVGTMGLGGRVLYDEVPPWVEPFDPANRLIFSTGPVTGSMTQTAGRHTVITKSPMTGYFGDASCGGYWGAELKFAGYDQVIVQGKATKPVYIWINDGAAEIRDASAYWGMDARETDRALCRDLGDKAVQVSCIGPAGENLVRYAAIMHDDAGRAAGRCGVGAVMGFMKLKAIAVRGHKRVPVANPDALREAILKVTSYYKESPQVQGLHAGGTPGYFAVGWSIGDSMSYNWQNENFKEFSQEKISWPGGYDLILAKTATCYTCLIACRRIANSGPDGPRKIEQGAEGVEYETLTFFGPSCGVDDVYTINKANDLCNLYGMDTISTASTIAFAMESFEKGLIDSKDTDGLALRFGNGDAVVEMVGKIARREGFGSLLAEGSRRAARTIGRGSEDFAMQVKGLEIAAHDPRAFQAGGGPHYATTVTGGRHTEGISLAFENFGAVSEPLGCPQPWDKAKSDPLQMVLVTKLFEDWVCMLNSMGYCYFSTEGRYGGKDDELNHISAYNAVTGLQMSVQDSLLVGERILNLRKAFNMRHGCTRSEDTLPKRLLTESNKRAGGAVVNLSQSLPEMYRLRGWDPATSKPTRAKLHELGLDDVAQDLWG